MNAAHPGAVGRALRADRPLPTNKLPQAGGLNATVVVTMTLDSLLGGLKAAQLDTGDHISASLARQLACEAGIIPPVLGGKSQVLDLGRSKTVRNQAQRIAKTIQTGGAASRGLRHPPGMTHLHHHQSWSDGGNTDLDDLIGSAPPTTPGPRPHLHHDELPTGRVRLPSTHLDAGEPPRVDDGSPQVPC